MRELDPRHDLTTVRRTRRYTPPYSTVPHHRAQYCCDCSSSTACSCRLPVAIVPPVVYVWSMAAWTWTWTGELRASVGYSIVRSTVLCRLPSGPYAIPPGSSSLPHSHRNPVCLRMHCCLSAVWASPPHSRPLDRGCWAPKQRGSRPGHCKAPCMRATK